MRNASDAAAPRGVTSIPTDEHFPIWNLSFVGSEEALLADPAQFAAGIAASPVSGIAFDLEGIGIPSPERTSAVLAFVDELQLRGVSVVVHGAPADFQTAVAFDGADARMATGTNLSGAVETLRHYDATRRRCTSDRGSRVNQLRMPARALSLAPICAYARVRLAKGGVEDNVALGLLHECYEHLSEILASGYEPGDGDFAVSVTVHEGRATITVLDGGRPRAAMDAPSGSDRVDRIHRFRILDRHNALVLEKQLGAVARA
ncbi:hypothetical protein K8I85_09125 [bacterium]|nr:hypothetical protein [bacterium]